MSLRFLLTPIHFHDQAFVAAYIDLFTNLFSIAICIGGQQNPTV